MIGNDAVGVVKPMFKVGDIPAGNCVTINKEQGVRYKGTSKVFKDMVGDIFGKRLFSAVGKVDYDFENNTLDFSSGGSITDANDRVGANLQVNHEFEVGVGMLFDPHIHRFQAVVSHLPDVLDSTAYEFTVRYRLVRNGYGVNLTTPEWTTIIITCGGVDDVFDTTNANGKEYIGQITFATPSISEDCGISDTFQIQMARTDALGGVVKVYFVDMHGAVDSDGSDDPLYKS